MMWCRLENKCVRMPPSSRDKVPTIEIVENVRCNVADIITLGNNKGSYLAHTKSKEKVVVTLVTNFLTMQYSIVQGQYQ